MLPLTRWLSNREKGMDIVGSLFLFPLSEEPLRWGVCPTTVSLSMVEISCISSVLHQCEWMVPHMSQSCLIVHLTVLFSSTHEPQRAYHANPSADERCP